MKCIAPAIAVAAMLFFPCAANADENSYLSELDHFDISFGTPQEAIRLGRSICDSLSAAGAYDTIVEQNHAKGMDPWLSRIVITIAADNLCAQHIPYVRSHSSVPVPG